jgi:hypothetical protein
LLKVVDASGERDASPRFRIGIREIQCRAMHGIAAGSDLI